jgi:glycosyltransferase involved in cell wall biosynthesis
VADHSEHPLIEDGIFLGYDKNIPLKNEGLGRLLAYLVSGWVKLPSRRLTIACPYWLVKDLQALLLDHGVAPESYQLLRTSEPWWRKVQLRLKEFERKIRPGVHRVRARLRGESLPAIDRAHRTWFERIFLIDPQRLVNAKNWQTGLLEALKIIVLIALAVWLLRILWPVILILLIVFVAYRFWRKYRRKRKVESPDNAKPVNLKKVMRKQKRRHKRYVQEVGQLIKQINEQQQVRHWLVPTPFWPEANRIEHAKSIVCPDLVLQQFPLRFSDPSTEPIYARILDTLQNAHKLICYSDLIRSRQLVQGVGLSPEQIDVIGHGRVELGEFLKLGKSVPDLSEQKLIALEFLRSYQRSFLADNPYWSRFAWDKSTYVFYSSQARGQKNILSLLRAIEILRHRSKVPVRLVLTCERSSGSDLDLFITEHRLDAWVLFAPGVSNQVLASLYCWASLAVNPTLFEGGFPFTFTEAYSVGTPSLLSDIPMVREKIVDPKLKEMMIFDPLDPQDLADKILWGVEHRKDLIEAQRGVFEAFPSWEMVAMSYSQSLRQSSE